MKTPPPTLSLLVLLLMASLSAAPPAGAGQAPAANGADDSPILATWKDGHITRDELESWQAFQNPAQDANLHPGDATAQETTESTEEALPEGDLRELAFWKILARQAEEDGLDATPRVRMQIESLRQVALVRALRKEVTSKVTVSDEEVEALRREHPEAFRRPRKLKLRNIYKRFPSPEEAPEIRQRMVEIRQELEDGASFADLAEQESESQSAPRGGALGWVDPDQLPPAVAAAVRPLTPGEISPPVDHADGVSLFLCEEVRAARVPSPDEVRAKIRTQLERVRKRDAWSELEQRLLDAASPALDPSSSSTVLSLPGYRLSAEDFAALVALRSAKVPGTLNAAQRRDVLETWAQHVVEVQRAVELGLDRRGDIARTLRWKRLKVLAQAELARRLRQEMPEPSEDELRALYDRRPQRFNEPPAYDLQAIFFGKPEGKGAAALVEHATAVAAKIASGELSFDEAARRDSKLPSASAGGAIGWTTKHQVALWGPTVSSAIRSLSPGQATGLLHRESGLWMYALRGTRAARILPFEEVEPKLHKEWAEPQFPDLAASIQQRELERSGFTLRPADHPKHPIIRWSTASEFESYGYHVYRSTSPDGPFERLTAEPIPGAGTSSVPHSYRYEDDTAEPGVTYYYYVEAISTSGRARRLTPIRASKGDRE